MPTQQALPPTLVPLPALPRALAINSRRTTIRHHLRAGTRWIPLRHLSGDGLQYLCGHESVCRDHDRVDPSRRTAFDSRTGIAAKPLCGYPLHPKSTSRARRHLARSARGSFWWRDGLLPMFANPGAAPRRVPCCFLSTWHVVRSSTGQVKSCSVLSRSTDWRRWPSTSRTGFRYLVSSRCRNEPETEKDYWMNSGKTCGITLQPPINKSTAPRRGAFVITSGRTAYCLGM